MRGKACVVAMALWTGACDEGEAPEAGLPDPFAAGKTDENSSLEKAWDPPRTLELEAPLQDQELAFSLVFDKPTQSSREETVDEDGTININVVLESDGRLVYEVGRYFVDLESDRAELVVEAKPEDDRFAARWLIGRPGEEDLVPYEGNRVILDRAAAGRYRIAVLTGETPELESVFRYAIAAY